MRHDIHHLGYAVLFPTAELRQNIIHFLQGVTEEQAVNMMKDII